MFPGTRYAKAESLDLVECNASKFKSIGNEKLNSKRPSKVESLEIAR